MEHIQFPSTEEHTGNALGIRLLELKKNNINDNKMITPQIVHCERKLLLKEQQASVIMQIIAK